MAHLSPADHSSPADQLPPTYVDQIRLHQLDAHYPSLLCGPWGDAGGVVHRHIRDESHLISVALRHDALSAEQRQQLSEFRLHQFVLCGWYDPRALTARDMTSDPAFDALPPESLHFVVGLPDGRCLAYTCLQPAGGPQDRVASMRVQYLTDADRPLFPTERELIGPRVFPALPALCHIPLGQIREWACSFRNRLAQSPLSVAALFDAFYTPLRLALQPEHAIRAILGNNNLDARKIYVALGVPILYAPLVPVDPPQDEVYWTPQVNEQGEFWPGVLACDDLREHTEYLNRIDAVLSLPPEEIRRALIRELNRSEVPAPRALAPEPDTTTVLWTRDPFFGRPEATTKRRARRSASVVAPPR